MCLVLSGSVHQFDIALLRKFTTHDDFALTVRYSSLKFVSQSHFVNEIWKEPAARLSGNLYCNWLIMLDLGDTIILTREI